MTIRVNYPTWQDAIRAIATFWNARFSNDRLSATVDTTGDVIVDSLNNGVVLKSANGKYWRSQISNTGVLTWVDLGTTKP